MRVYREAAGLSRKEAALKIGTTTATLSRWENGIVMPNDDRKIEIAERYGVEPSTIFPLERSRS